MRSLATGASLSLILTVAGSAGVIVDAAFGEIPVARWVIIVIASALIYWAVAAHAEYGKRDGED